MLPLQKYKLFSLILAINRATWSNSIAYQLVDLVNIFISPCLDLLQYLEHGINHSESNGSTKWVMTTEILILFFQIFKMTSDLLTRSPLYRQVVGISGQMLKGPVLKSLGLYILVFQDRPDRGAFNMFKNMFENSFTIGGYLRCSKICSKIFLK